MLLQSLSNWSVRMPVVQQLARGSIVAVGTSAVEGASDIVDGYGSTVDSLACLSPLIMAGKYPTPKSNTFGCFTFMASLHAWEPDGVWRGGGGVAGAFSQCCIIRA